jgi:diguanylate cyclase (GGDEF)-like protein
VLHTTWKGGSLRFWVFVSMALAIVPLLISAVAGFVLLKHGAVSDFRDVAARYRDQIAPSHRLQLHLWEATDPIDLYLDDRDAADANAYRTLRQTIEGEFAQVRNAVSHEPEALGLVERARADWTEADRIAAQILARRWTPGAADGVDLARQFDTNLAAAVDRLAAVTDDLKRDLDADHLDADRSYERAEWLAAIAAAITLMSMIGGVALIGRLLRTSVDRLVDGAERFASGDRDHRIDVQVPPELHRVAREFNVMIARIRESESLLADLARRDKLTNLLNRRALDDGLREALARRDRLNENFVLLLLDIDHFKAVNDTHGHGAGDEVLRIVAQTLLASVREVDKAFRVGGEEFVLLLSDTDGSSGLMTAERVRTSVADTRIPVGAAGLAVTVSIGLAEPRDGDDPDAMVRAADRALYEAKRAGRNQVIVAERDGAVGVNLSATGA